MAPTLEQPEGDKKQYVVIIAGLKDSLTVRAIEDLIGDVKMYLDDEGISYEDVRLELEG